MAAFDAKATAARPSELDAAPLNGRFDDSHFRGIRKRILRVYSCAGELSVAAATQLTFRDFVRKRFAIDTSRESLATGSSLGLGNCVYSCLLGL